MNIKRILIPAIALLTVASLFSSCKKDEDVTQTPVDEQMLSFHLHTKVGNQVANYTTVYTDATGRKFNLSDLRYYISNIILIKSDNSEYPISGKVLLVNPSESTYNLAKVPVGSYKGFKFTLGLDSATNHSDPASYASGHPLSIQSPSIHWAWNSGYIFLKWAGQCDTSLAADGNADYPYIFDCGLDQNKRVVDFSNGAFTITSGQDFEIGIDFRVLNLFNNLDLRTENSTHSMDNLPLAAKIMDNAAQSFFLE